MKHIKMPLGLFLSLQFEELSDLQIVGIVVSLADISNAVVLGLSLNNWLGDPDIN